MSFSGLERALAETEDVSGLKLLHDQLEAVQRLAAKMQLALADQNRIAELRIRTARKAGAILARTVKRGGNSRGGSSAPLPDGISWNQSSRWQKLAKISDSVLQRYIAAAGEGGEELTLAGFLRAGQAGNLDVHFSSERAEWLTPPPILEASVELMGAIDLDPCADNGKNVPATTHYTEDDDGLSKPWFGRVYMNPPYGAAIEAWVEALATRFEAGEVKEAVALLPSRTDTAWFRLLRHHPRSFINGRLTFSGHQNPAPFPSVVVYLGRRSGRFVRVFSPLGDVYALAAS